MKSKTYNNNNNNTGAIQERSDVNLAIISG